MFDEDKINELLRGASPKKKKSPSHKNKSKKDPQKDAPINTETNSNSKKDTELTPELLQEIGGMIGSTTGRESAIGSQSVSKEKNVSMKNMHQRQDYIHERKLAEDRLRRLKDAEKRIQELERERREAANQIEQAQTKFLQKEQQEDEQVALLREQLTQIQGIVEQQKEQIQVLHNEKESLSSRYLELQNAANAESQKQQEGKEITQVFQEHGLQSGEYPDVIIWLIQTGIFPLSYFQTPYHDLLKQILHDKCHIQAPNIPLPKESNDLYIPASLQRCPLSGGKDITENARLFKDECLIHGYTTIVMFGTQGSHEPLFQVLFAHHALRVTLSPLIHTMTPAEFDMQIQTNQLAFSWGGDNHTGVNYTSNAQSVGGFLHDLVSYLRSLQ